MTDIVKWNPFRELAGYFNEMDKMFAPFWELMSEGLGHPEFTGQNINLQVHEEGGEIVITGDIPGAVKDNLNVVVHQDRVIVSGETKSTTENNGAKVYQWSKFSRAVGLPARVKSESATVNVQNGALKIRASKE